MMLPSNPLPELTVLMSVHNGAAFLERALKSIQDQTHLPIRIMCIDDASTDTTPQILLAWQKVFGSARMNIITNGVNRGLTASLNAGLKLIATPYTARLDADDWWEPTKIAKQIQFLEMHPQYGVVGTHYLNQNSSKTVVVSLPNTDASIRKNIIRKNPFAHSAVVFRTPFIQSLDGYDERVRYGQDYDLWLRCLPLTKFANLPEVLCYRSVGQGISVERQRAQMWQGIRTQIKYIRKYNLPVFNYFFILELAAVLMAPEWLKSMKRKVFL